MKLQLIENNFLHLPLTRELLIYCTKYFSERNPSFDDPFRDKSKIIPEIIRGYKVNYATQKIEVKRGLKPYIIQFLYRKGYDYEIIDETCSHKIKVHFQFPNPIYSLRDYQKIGKLAFFKKGTGIISFDCGLGKTVLALSIIGDIKLSTIVLVHTTNLLEQWLKEISILLHGDYTVGKIGDGCISFGDITVALFQSFGNLLGNKEIFEKYGLVIIDECHHTPAETFYNIVSQFKAKCFLGLSATLKRKDCKEFMLKFLIGDCLYQKKRQDIGITQLLFIRRFTYIPTETRVLDKKTKKLKIKKLNLFRKMPGTKKKIANWVDTIGGICYHKKRTEDIVYDVVTSIKMGRKPLVLSERVEHCKEIYTALQPYCTVKLAIGGDSDGLEHYKEHPEDFQVIVGTKVADEGMDIPALDTLFLTCPMSLKDIKGEENTSLLDQRIGRIARIFPGKTQIQVYLYIDMFIDFLNEATNDMKNYLENGGFKTQNLN